jgi:hypothetical protein
VTVQLLISPHVLTDPITLGPDVSLPASAEREPSLTLCTTRVFFGAAGVLSQAVGAEVRRLPTFIALSGARDGWNVRWTSQFIWLAQDEVPSARHEWHIDRVGPGWTNNDSELADYSDNARAADDEVLFGVASYFWPDSAEDGAVADLGTEFLPERLAVPLERLVDDPRIVGQTIARCVNGLAGSGRTVTHGSNVVTWFSARTLHRPPIAARPGWRFFLRVGLYREPHSPFSDHRLLCHRIWDSRTGQSRFRPLGTQQSLSAWNGPLSRPI